MSSLQNLEQIRAKSALAFANAVAAGQIKATGKEGGEAMKKIPPMIMANGLLAAVAFAIEEKKDRKTKNIIPTRPGFMAIFDAIGAHLCSPEIAVTNNTDTAKKLVDVLAEADSHTLKLATDEALAWLSYARRFVGGADSN